MNKFIKSLSDIDTIPPKSAQNNALRGLELRKKWGRGGTDIGVARARDLSNGKSLSESTIKRMASFNRHRNNYKPDKRESDGGQTAGTISWLLWGGTSGIDWAIQKSKEFREERNRMSEKKEFKNLGLNIEIKQDNDEMTFKAYGATTGNVDNGNDLIEKGAFYDVIQSAKNGKMPKLLYQHDHKKVVGVITDIYEDEKGLVVEGRFINTTLGKDTYEEVKSGAIDSMSIGYYVKEFEIDRKQSIRIIKSFSKLAEVSFVTFPMNDQAEVLNVKSEDGNINPRALERTLRDAGLSQKEAKTIISGGIKSINQRDVDNSEQIKETLESLIQAFK